MDTNNNDEVKQSLADESVPAEDSNNIKVEAADEPTNDTVAKDAAAEKSGFLSRFTQRQKLIGLIGVVLALIISAGVLLFMVEDEPADTNIDDQVTVTEPAPQLAAAIALVEGQVQYSQDGGETWTDADGGETVEQSDYVRTLADSRGVVLLDDGSAVRLGPDSIVYMSESTEEDISVTLEQGQLYSRVVENGSREFSVDTNTESFIAQGTAYRVSTDEESAKLEVYQSKVEVASDETVVDEGNGYDTNSKETTEIDLNELADDEFVQWNKQQDEKSDEFKNKLGVLDIEPESEAKPDVEPAPSASLALSANPKNSGIAFNWSVNGASAPNGFKLLRSKSATPVYGSDKSVYISGSSQRSYTLGLKDGATYNFRLCIYRPSSNSCDTYSNSVQVTAPLNPVVAVKSGDVSLAIDGQKLSWTFDGTAPHGFKVLLSTSQNPTYPDYSINFTTETSFKLPSKPDGTYYVRVCKYTADSEVDGGCTDYSNQEEYLVEG